VDDADVEHMLTTIDNPWNPFTNYDEWWEFDREKGYNTAGFLARVADVSLDLSDVDVGLAIEQAITTICTQNVLGLYKKVAKPNLITS
jgi:hypothetical protein